MNPSILRIPINPADQAALAKAIQPIRNSPKFAWAFGVGFAVLVVAFMIAAAAPWHLTALMPLVSIGAAWLWVVKENKNIQKIDEDLAKGTMIEVRGVLENRYIAGSGTANTRFRWRISGQDYMLHRRYWHNAKNNQHVRLCYLEGSGLTFIAQPDAQ